MDPINPSIQILLADDHSLIRHGLHTLLQHTYPSSNIIETESFDGVAGYLSDHNFQLIILDISMPGGESVQMIDYIRVKHPDAKILIYSAYEEEIYAPMYIQAGANGYMMKSIAVKEIIKAVNTVLADQVYVSEQVKQHLLMLMNKKRPENYYSLAQLSRRETEVAQLLVQGKNLSEIAIKLNLQSNTISTYKSRIYEKLGVNNLVQLIDKCRSMVK